MVNTVATIRAYRERAEQLRDSEVEKAIRQLTTGDINVASAENTEKLIRQLAHSLTNKLIHIPSVTIKQAGYDGRTDLVDAACELFNLKNSDT